MKFPGNYNNFQSKSNEILFADSRPDMLSVPRLFPTIVLHHLPRDSQVLAPGLQPPGEMGRYPLGPLLSVLPPSCWARGHAPAAVSSSDWNQPVPDCVTGDSASCHVGSGWGLLGRRACSLPRPHVLGQAWRGLCLLHLPLPISPLPLALHRPQPLINK